MELMTITLFLLLTFNQANAFTLNNNVSAAFDRDVVKVNVDDRSCTHLDASPAEILDMVGEAVDSYWNTVPTSSLKLEKGGLLSVDNAFNTESICEGSGSGSSCTPNPALKVNSGVLIACNTKTSNFDNVNGVLAVTIPNNISERVINGAVILIQDIANNAFDGLSRREAVAVIAHEIGHAIGLGHSPVDDSLMYYASIPTRFSLGWDDIDGVTYLYPAGQPVSCGSISTNADNDNRSSFWGTFIFGLAAIAFLFKRKKFSTT